MCFRLLLPVALILGLTLTGIPGVQHASAQTAASPDAFRPGPGAANEALGNEALGNEVLGNEVLGNEVLGNEVLGNEVLVQAAADRPYGVATIEVPVAQPTAGPPLAPIEAASSSGRVLYPYAEDVRVKLTRPSETPVPPPGRGRLLGRVGNLIREITSGGEELEQTVARRVSFLFTGSDPLQVTLRDARGEIGTYEIVPSDDPALHRELMTQWWQGYAAAAERQIAAADYPTWVENYLVAMLAGRTQMQLPPWYADTKIKDDELLDTMKLIAGVEGAGDAFFRRAAIGTGDEPAASLPLPPPPNWAPPFAQPELAGVPTEPLASRVPPECFYIRYGSFANYLWFRDLSDEYGGDISRMISLRGIENDAARRFERQLNLKTTELSRMLGASVIEDQAIIGRDLFLADGASIGVIFKVSNAFLLRTSLTNDRAQLARQNEDVTLETVTIADQSVSFLSTADNQVRSFMAEQGGYILVTNSRSLVERFFQVADGGPSLASTASFQLARQLLPLERDDTIFAYFSPAMLQGLVSPQYLIELRRRLYAKSDIAMVHMARLAAAQELSASGTDISGIDELTAMGFLPAGFGLRPDGSGVITVGDHVMDTRRGARGTFLPIADTPIDAVTAEEAAWYRRIADQYSQQFPTLDPIMVGLGRRLVEGVDGIERVTIDAEVAPWNPEKYGEIARQLGPPTRVAMQFAPDDIVAVQAHVASPQLGPPTHLFAAVKDSVPPEPEDFDGFFNVYRSLRQIPGYLGAWPQPGALDRLPLGLGRGQPVGPGMSRLLGGLYRYSDGQFSILSFQPEVLNASLPFLAADDVDDAAQIRMRIGNLRGSRLENWVNDQLYDRARESSVAGANFLSMLTRQLKVDPQQVPQAAEEVLGAKLQCTLGGTYQYSPVSGRWISTAWQGETAPLQAPPHYTAPMMQWFRGATAQLTQYEDRVVADAMIDIARQ